MKCGASSSPCDSGISNAKAFQLMERSNVMIFFIVDAWVFFFFREHVDYIVFCLLSFHDQHPSPPLKHTMVLVLMTESCHQHGWKSSHTFIKISLARPLFKKTLRLNHLCLHLVLITLLSLFSQHMLWKFTHIEIMHSLLLNPSFHLAGISHSA